MSQEQAAAAVIIALISEKNKSRKKKQKKSRYETVASKKEKFKNLWNSACRTAVRML